MDRANSVLFSLLVYARSLSQYAYSIDVVAIHFASYDSIRLSKRVACISNTLYHGNYAQYDEEKLFALIAKELRISKVLNGGSLTHNFDSCAFPLGAL
jgi:hypothetical protein